MKKRRGILLDLEGERVHQICGFLWADNFWIMSHSKENLEQMLRDLIEEASRWYLVPKPASLWWTSTYDSEEKSDMILGISTGCYKFPFEDKFKILGCAVNRQGKRKMRFKSECSLQQGLLAGHSDIQEQSCSVEIKVSKTGGPRLCSLCVRE